MVIAAMKLKNTYSLEGKVVNFMDYSLGTTAEGFVLSHASLRNNEHLNILSSQLNQRKERTSQNHKT